MSNQTATEFIEKENSSVKTKKGVLVVVVAIVCALITLSLFGVVFFSIMAK
jgi:CHASE1-domain containing sensor protein